VDEISQEALTKALDGLLAEPHRLSLMSEAALSWASQRFQWGDVAKKIIHLSGQEENSPSMTRASEATTPFSISSS
jgi:hypothetical protein